MYETKPYDNNEDEIRKMTKEADKNTKNRNGTKRITTQSKSSNDFATLRIKTIFEMINLHTVNELNLQMPGCVNVCEPYANHDFLAGSKEFESIRNPTIRKNTFCDPSNFNSEIENLFIDYIIVNELEVSDDVAERTLREVIFEGAVEEGQSPLGEALRRLLVA